VGRGGVLTGPCTDCIEWEKGLQNSEPDVSHRSHYLGGGGGGSVDAGNYSKRGDALVVVLRT